MGQRHSVKTKREALKHFQQGLGRNATARILGLPQSSVRVWHDLFRAGNLEWVTNSFIRTDPALLEEVVREYISTGSGFHMLAQRYGISGSTILRGYRNYLNYGMVTLPRGRNAMKKLQEQKQALVERLREVDDGSPLSKKEVKEMHDLLAVNISLLEVILETNCPELKKKELRQQKDRLERRLAYVKRVLSSS